LLQKTEEDFQRMFMHASKLTKIIGPDKLNSYRRIFFFLREMQKTGQIKMHKNYLNDNDLATNIYKRKYFLKDVEGRLIEKNPEQVFARLASFMASVEEGEIKQNKWAIKFYNAMYEGKMLPGGRVIAGAGDLYRLKTMANCFAAGIDEDNLESIYKTAYECARTYSYGGGIGVDISVLRPKDSIVHNAADKSTGAVSFMELYSLTTGLIGQSGRRGALMLTVDVKHPDVLHFIKVKKVSNWITNQVVEQCKNSGNFNPTQLDIIEKQVRENTQVRFANISIKVSDEFMQAVEEQNTYGKRKILVYKNYSGISPKSVAQGGGINYSFGMPSKVLSDYELYKTFETIDELNKFLSEFSTSVHKEDLDEVMKRDVFGDYVVNLENQDFNIAIKYAGDFLLYFMSPQTGEIKHLLKARDIWNSFVEGNYKTAEPGLIFWTNMIKHSPSNYVGVPILSTNPCIIGSSLVPTERGLERMKDLVEREHVSVLTDNRVPLEIRNYDGTAHLLRQESGMSMDLIENIWKTGLKETLKLTTKSGYELVATPDHKIMTKDGWKKLKELNLEEDEILIQGGKGMFNNDDKLPFEVCNEFKGKNKRKYKFNFPSRWSKELGELLGWIVGDGFLTADPDNRACLVFGKGDEEIQKKMKLYMEKIYRSHTKTSLRQSSSQLRYHSKYLADYLRKLGVKSVKAGEKTVPESLFTSTQEAVKGFLRGLFTADGTISVNKEKGNYIRLTSKSEDLLKEVQMLLLNMGMLSRIYPRHRQPRTTFKYTTKKGQVKFYLSDGVLWELQLSRGSAKKFLEEIGFMCSKHDDKIKKFLKCSQYKENFFEKIKKIESDGMKEVFDLTEPRTHSFIANGIVVSNCGEVPLEDGGACNLGSVNLSRFVINGYTNEAYIDWEDLKDSVETLTRMLDNVVTWNEMLNPLEKQRKAARETRRLGIGIMGIADMLNQLGNGYDSPEGTEMMEKVSKFIANVTYQASAKLAEEKEPSSIFNYEAYSKGIFFQEALADETKDMIRDKGLRNIALLSIAPTGTISNIILGFKNGDKHYIGVSGGIEPIFAIYYTRRVESFQSKSFKLFHSTVQAYIDLKDLGEKAQNAKNDEELAGILPLHFFKTAHHIDPEKRVKIQGICQKYIDHSISSTVNLSESIEPETISDIYIRAWKYGLKGITVYRDGSRFPILSIESKRTKFQEIKEKTFKITNEEGHEVMLKGDEVFVLPDGTLTTPYHALQKGPIENTNSLYRFIRGKS